jgi:hypothetical protein
MVEWVAWFNKTAYTTRLETYRPQSSRLGARRTIRLNSPFLIKQGTD